MKLGKIRGQNKNKNFLGKVFWNYMYYWKPVRIKKGKNNIYMHVHMYMHMYVCMYLSPVLTEDFNGQKWALYSEAPTLI